jgi:hypothetical protein
MMPRGSGKGIGSRERSNRKNPILPPNGKGEIGVLFRQKMQPGLGAYQETFSPSKET